MANTKSTQKRIKTNEKQHLKNLTRKSELKTIIKKVLEAVEKKDSTLAKDLLKKAESKIARASRKKVLKKNTASRKVSRLAKKVSCLVKTK